MARGVWEGNLWRDVIIEVVARQRVALSGVFLGAMLFGFCREFALINRKVIPRMHTSRVVFFSSFLFVFHLFYTSHI